MKREIDVRQLFLYILMRWRTLLAVFIVCALLGGAYTAWRGGARNSAKKDEPTALYELKFSLYQRLKDFYSEQIEELTRQIEVEKEYQEKSLTMKIDAANASVLSATLTFDAEPEESDPAHGLLTAINGDAFWQGPAKQLATTPQNIREVVTAKAGPVGSGRLDLTITAPDAKTAEELLAHITAGAKAKPIDTEKKLTVRVDRPLADLQRNRINALVQLTNQLLAVRRNQDQSVKEYVAAQAEELTRQIKTEKADQEKSLKMRINPAQATVLTATLTFEAEGTPAEQLIEAMQTDAFWAGPVAKLDTTPQYLREVITTKPNPAAGQLQMEILAPETGIAEDLLAHILAGAKKQLKRADKTITVKAHRPLADQQRSKMLALTSLTNSLRGVYGNLDGLREPNPPFGVARRSDLAAFAPVSRKQALISGALSWGVSGLLCGIIFLALRLILSGRVLSADEFFTKYPYQRLAVLSLRAQRAKMRALDRLLLRRADHPRFAHLSERERYETAADGIRAQVQKGDVLLLGVVDLTRLEQIRTALAARLPGVTFAARHFVNEQIHTMLDIDRHDNVVLVEGILESRYPDIDVETQVLADKGKNVLGCILA